MTQNSSPIDLAGDTGTHLWYTYAAQKQGFCAGSGNPLVVQPDYVKKASQEQLTGSADLSERSFADRAGRRFPCHTPAATWASSLYLHMQKAACAVADYQLWSKRLDAAADYHGVRPDIEQLKQAALQANLLEEDSLPDTNFALVAAWPNGQKERHLPLRNSAEVKTACAYLQQYGREFVYEDRARVATRILERAQALGVELGPEREELEKRAGWGACSGQSAAEVIAERCRRLQHRPEAAQELESLLKQAISLLEQPAQAHSPLYLQGLAAKLDQVDRQYHLLDCLPPELELFQLTVKQAQDLQEQHVLTCTGRVYRTEDLSRLRLSDIAGLWGDGFAQRVSAGGIMLDQEKLAAELRQLGPEDAELFDRLAGQTGVEPRLQQNGQLARQVPEEHAQALVDWYRSQSSS